MALHIGDTAPNFVASTTQGEIEFHKWIGRSWAFFFSHPADFTPVCTTEVGSVEQLANEFAYRNVKPIGLSTDTLDHHYAWLDDINDTHHTDMHFPLIADSDLKIARLYDMIHSEESDTMSVRSIFIIDPNKKIRIVMTYPMAVGRGLGEVLRVIDALRLSDKCGILTPANWLPGEKVIIPNNVSNEEAMDRHLCGWEEVLPYMRTTYAD